MNLNKEPRFQPLIRFFLLTSLAIFLNGCSVLHSSYHYTRGTSYIDNKDYDNAITHLEKAVHLYPLEVRNHLNLSYAYLQKQNFPKAWRHCRFAVLLNENDPSAKTNFQSLWTLLMREYEFSQNSHLKFKVIDLLGQPDITFSDPEKGTEYITYGLIKMEFCGQKLINISEFSPRLYFENLENKN